MKIERLSLDGFREWAVEAERCHYGSFAHIIKGVEEYTSFFVLDLWDLSETPDFASNDALFDDVTGWLADNEVPYKLQNLTMASVLIAIREPRDAFHFLLRFR